MINLSTWRLFKRLKNVPGTIELTAAMLHDLHQCLLTILDDVDDICARYGIRYMLSGGNVLGAVRHKGFIPWDDDVDIYMERKEFTRFMAVFAQEHGDRYWVQSPTEVSEYNLLLGRVRLKQTSYRTREDFNSDIDGVFIDIFIIENTFDNVLLRTLHGFGCLALGLALSCRRFFHDRAFLAPMMRTDQTAWKVFRIKKALGFLTAFLSVGQWRRLADAWNRLCTNDNSTYIVVPIGTGFFFGTLARRDVFCPTVLMEFEGRLLPVPKNYVTYLTKQYGDYLWIPPEDQREKHIVFNFKV